MVSFVAGTPVTTDTPGVAVDAGLPVGQHRFRLIVLGNSGTRSRPDEIVVRVQRLIVPPVVGPVVRPVVTGPVIVRPPIADPVRPPGPLRPTLLDQPAVATPIRRPPARRSRRKP